MMHHHHHEIEESSNQNEEQDNDDNQENEDGNKSKDDDDDDDDATDTTTTVSRHYFGHYSSNDDDEQKGALFIDIIENMQEDYGMFIWPCSIVLAEYVWQQRTRFLGRSVVEIGAGTSLPGLVAAKVGAGVLLTDKNRVEVLDNMRRTVEMNNLHCKILGLDWGEWDDSLFDIIPDIVLGADVFYETRDFEDLFASVTFLMKKSPQSVFMTTYDNRSGHHLIEFLMVKWGWKCTKLSNAFSFMPSSKATKLQGNIQLLEIMLDSKN